MASPDITSLVNSAARAGRPPLVRRERASTEDGTISFAQQRLWYISQFESGLVTYNQPFAWKLTGTIDPDALRSSLDKLAFRHPSLRTNFPVVNGDVASRIVADRTFPLTVTDLRTLAKDRQAAAQQELIASEARYPFDLAEESLMRAALIRTDDEEYILVLTLHHIIHDGWSLGILLRELAQLYRASVTSANLALPELVIEYSDFAEWQRETLTGQQLDAHLTFWKEALAGANNLNMPADRPRPRLQTFRGASWDFKMQAPVSQAVKGICAEEGVTTFTVLMAAFQALCFRYTGQEDVTLGVFTACRKPWQIQQVVGLFSNVVPVRTTLNGDLSFRGLLHKTRESLTGTYQHQDLPFDKLVEELRLARDQSLQPLFQHVLGQVDEPWLRLDLHGASSRRLHVNNATSKFDLTVYLGEIENTLGGWVEYSTDLYDDSTIRGLLEHYEILLAALAENPDQSIARASLLSANERRRLLVDENNTKAEYPDSTIHELFHSQAERLADQVALIDGDLGLSYGELAKRVNLLAQHLRRAGVEDETPIGICMERSADMVVAMLGILSAGAAYVPLDPGFPQERLEFMRDDAGIFLAITTADQEQLVSALGIQAICLDRIGQREEAAPAPVTPKKVAADALAYVIYTSGSTGRPKGVLGTHCGVVNRIRWMADAYPYETGEICCFKTSVNFVDSIAEVFGPLSCGIPLVIIRDEEVKDPQRMLNALEKHSITRLVLVPSLLRVLLDSDPKPASRLPKLKYWISSGEVLDSDLARRFQRSLPGAVLINLYGASEVSADATYYQVTDPRPSHSIPIGRPIANTQICILDKLMQPVPIGVPGEIFVGGDGLARGYLKLPRQTADRFIVSPLPELRSARLYRTGDIGRYLSSGEIEFLGRMDGQVKVRGFRIETNEVEAALNQCPGVQQAIVMVREDSPGDKRLTAYMVAEDGAKDTLKPADIRRLVAEHLPEYMVPTAFAILDSFPMLPGGKVDRYRLPPPSIIRYTDAAEERSRSEVETVVAGIWTEVLQLNDIRMEDNFLDLGGHSLLAMQVITKLKKTLNISPDPREVMNNSLEQFAAACEARLKQSRTPGGGLLHKLSQVFGRA
jgi:amino acid adenylation domain-containing protein